MMMPNHNRTERAACTRRMGAVAAVCFAALTGILGGCEQEKLTIIRTEDEFHRRVLESRQPVIVEFSKDQCPTCVVLESELVGVSKEYAGRVQFYKFMLLNRFFQPYSPAIKNAYKLDWVPTAILFIDGQERQRWNNVYIVDSYRDALTEVVGPPEKSQTSWMW